jgi:hypothetical protein
MDKTVSVSKIIIGLIQESKDENIRGKAIREESWLQRITFSDVMDIVLFYISLQPDVKNIGKIKSIDFYHLVEHTWKQWIADKNNRAFIELNSAWSNGPGPMDGTAGPAEMYMYYHPGMLGHKRILEFFYCCDNWTSYLEHMKIMVFPKWRRENNLKNISSVFHLAEMICSATRKEVAAR